MARGRRWTEDEIQVVRQRYPNEPISAIADILNRSIESVRFVAKRLRIRKTQECLKRKRQKSNGKFRGAETGSEYVDANGYRKRKVMDTGKFDCDWKLVHQLLWIEHNGPIPHGHLIAFKDGNKENITIENLECVSRSEFGKRHSVWKRYPKELAEVIFLRARVARKIKNMEREES